MNEMYFLQTIAIMKFSCVGKKKCCNMWISLGRENCLPFGNHHAAWCIAIIYSLMASCKVYDVKMQEWLTMFLIEFWTTTFKNRMTCFCNSENWFITDFQLNIKPRKTEIQYAFMDFWYHKIYYIVCFYINYHFRS